MLRSTITRRPWLVQVRNGKRSLISLQNYQNGPKQISTSNFFTNVNYSTSSSLKEALQATSNDDDVHEPKYNVPESILERNDNAYDGKDEFSERKIQLLQYLQNSLWHDVDHMIEKIQQKNPKRSFIKFKVNESSWKRIKTGKKFVQEKNMMRLQKRRERRGEDEGLTIVPSGNEALSAINMDVVEEKIDDDINNDDEPMETSSLMSLLEDDTLFPSATEENVEEQVSTEKNRLLALFDDSDTSTSTGEIGSKTREDSASVNLMNLLNDDGFFDKIESESNTKSESKSQSSLLDLLDDDLFAESHTSMDSVDAKVDKLTGNRDSNTSLLDLLSDSEPNEQESSRNNASSSSLLDLLNEDEYMIPNTDEAAQKQTNNETIPNHKDTAEMSLLELLDNDEWNVDDVQDISNYGSTDAKMDESLHSATSTSLVDLLDKEENFADVKSDDLHAFVEEEIEEVIESFSIKDVVSKCLSLVNIMRKSEWELCDKAVEDIKNAVKEKEDEHEEELLLNLFGESEDTENVIFDHDRGEEFVEEIISGSSAMKYSLKANEFNVLLLHVAMSSRKDKVEKLLDIYLHMSELAKSGWKNSGPNGDTYTILLSLFNSVPGCSQIGYEVYSQMMERITEVSKDGSLVFDEENPLPFNEECLDASMRMLLRRLDIEGAENLMDFALSDASNGVRVSTSAFQIMHLLYKSDNEQEKALKLVDECIEENLGDWDGIHKYLLTAVSWPRRNREGRKIAISSYVNSMMDTLEACEEKGIYVKPGVWRKMLGISRYLVNSEGGVHWSLVHRCVKSLTSSSEVSRNGVDERLLVTGLKAAEKMEDTQLVADLICGVADSQSFDSYDIDNQKPSLKISPTIYAKAIKFCVEFGAPSQADRILTHSSRQQLPTKFIADFHTMVLTGYAKAGDTAKAEHLLHQMEMAGIEITESTRSAYMYALAISGQHNKVMTDLETLLNENIIDKNSLGKSIFHMCIMSALKSEKYEDVIEINEKMKMLGIESTAASLQGTIIAKKKMGDHAGFENVIQDAIEDNVAFDVNVFILASRHYIPDILANGKVDIEGMRKNLRKISEEKPDISYEALELSKSLRDCLREENRKPSKMKSQIVIEKLKKEYWRQAMIDAIKLSKALK